LRILSQLEEFVSRLLAEQGVLLTSAIIALVHALRENPGKYNIIFDNTKYDDNTDNEYLEALLEVASSFLKILLCQMMDKTMVAAVKTNVME
jgi:hypothetical protein